MAGQGGAITQRRGASGQAAVEFALTSLLFLTLVFGTLDLGRAVFTRTMLTNAVREAARQASITPTNAALIKAAADQRSPTLNLASSAFVVTCDTWAGGTRNCDPNAPIVAGTPAPVQPLDRLTVCTDYPFNLVAARLIGRATITFRECEQASVQ
jgi:Flp pilus assembly protein TadG